MKEGDYLLINNFKPAFSTSDRTIKIIVKLGCEYITKKVQSTVQPKWWQLTVIYSDDMICDEYDEFCVCIHRLDHLDCKVIPETEALAIVI